MRIRSFALLSSIVTASALLATPAFAVANGQSAAPGQYPFVVKLTGLKCTAALITPRYIITAGHCFLGLNGNPIFPTFAAVGKSDESDQSGHVIRVVNVQQSSRNDIAVAKLASPVSDVNPIGISQSPPYSGEQLTLAGWGATNSAIIARQASHLQYGTVGINSVARYTIGVHGIAPRADTSACEYDSGAPYFVGNALVAVEHDGPDCPHPHTETTERVDTIAGWIRDAIR
jgi:secreted trypsin-like serine protease